MRLDLSTLLTKEIDAAIKSVLSDVEKHLLPDETQLNVQVNCLAKFQPSMLTHSKSSGVFQELFPFPGHGHGQKQFPHPPRFSTARRQDRPAPNGPDQRKTRRGFFGLDQRGPLPRTSSTQRCARPRFTSPPKYNGMITQLVNK